MPYHIFQKLQDLPPSVYHAQNSAIFDDTTFEKYYFSVIEPWANSQEGSKVVIGNNLIKHFNTTIIDACNAADITFVSLPKEAIDVSYQYLTSIRMVTLLWQNKDGGVRGVE